MSYSLSFSYVRPLQLKPFDFHYLIVMRRSLCWLGTFLYDVTHVPIVETRTMKENILNLILPNSGFSFVWWNS